jgi:sulfite reductase (ferredoxin)
MADDAAPSLSPVEGIKDTSRRLRGTLADELQQPTDSFSDPSKQLLKFHGTYQQEDRDARKNRSKAGVGKHYMFMVRTKMPGGKITAAQYLAIDDLAGQFANGTVRFTTRQGIQLHGILKTHLKETIAGINATLISTLGACGDVNRNVMACPAPIADGVRPELQRLADAIADHLTPRSGAYHEIWLNGRPVADPLVQEAEPIYGKTYLPRKFKIALGLCADNCVDIYAQDLGFLAIVEAGQLVGFNVLVGGGMGTTHGKPETFPHLGQAMCFVTPANVVAMAESVIKLYRDHGNRGDRKRARIKYLVADWGVEAFRAKLAEYAGPLTPPKPATITGSDLHLGWHPQRDGKFFYGLSVENGRVKDEGAFRLRSALRIILTEHQPTLRVTGQQDVLLCDLPESARARIEATLTDHGIPLPTTLTPVQQWSMACPAIPTCGLAISESERALPGIVDELEAELATLGLRDEPLSIRMTGCPNGCARPYSSDIGIVGRSGDKYTLYVGGTPLGHRLNFVLQDLVPRAQLVPTLRKLLARFQHERQGHEGFGDYCARVGKTALAE